MNEQLYESKGTIRGRLLAVVREREIDLGAPVTETMKLDLARASGANPVTVRNVISTWRRRLGIRLRAGKSRAFMLAMGEQGRKRRDCLMAAGRRAEAGERTARGGRALEEK